MSVEEVILGDGTKVYRYDADGAYYKRVFVQGERTVEELCATYGYNDWSEEYNRPINHAFRARYSDPQALGQSSGTPLYLLLPAAKKKQVNTFVRSRVLPLIKGVAGPDTAEYGARVSGSPLTIQTYQYTVQFSRTLTDAERGSLAELEWAVVTEDSSENKGSAIKVAPKGISIDLTIKYEYAERKIYVGPVINDKLVYAKSKITTVPFSVPLVPEIMRRIVDSNTKTTLYPVGISLQERWFNTNSSSVFTDGQSDGGKAFDNTLVTLDWVKSFTRGKAKYDEFVKTDFWFSDSLKEALLKRFEANGLLGQSSRVLWAGFPGGQPMLARLPDPTTSMPLFASCYEQHMAWDWTQMDPNDDLKATLANCDWRMAFEGWIDPRDGDKKQLVTITRCGVFIRDSFDFVDSQLGGLGDWRANPPAISSGSLSSDFTDVDNAMYRAWRAANGIGHDFLVYTDVEFFAPSPGARFRILDEAAWLGFGSRIEDA